jgi:hypothetical protein
MTPIEYGERVQDALRALIEKRFREDASPVHNRAELSRALGHGEARQYVASRFKPDPKSGKLRDFTVPDLLSFAAALNLDGSALLDEARAIVDVDAPQPTKLKVTHSTKKTPKRGADAATKGSQ